MKVIAASAGRDGSGEYRINMPVKALQDKGYDVQVVDPQACGAAQKAAQADVIVFNRPHNPKIMGMIEDAHQQGIAVVIDIDDLFDCLDTRHSMYAMSQRMSPVVHEACAAADLVTCTTPKLAEFYGYGHARVIPNFISASWLEITGKPEHDQLRIGWTGTVASHPRDLQVMGNGLRRATEDQGGEFVYIGHENPRVVGQFAGVRKAMSYGWASFEQYPYAYSSFDIAVVPLADTQFNAAKSWLKGLEAAALGVPFAASPTVEYERLGAGMLAHDPSDWRRKVGALLKDESLRADLAAQGRETAAGLTIEGNCEQYWDAWTDAHLAQRSTPLSTKRLVS